MEFGLVTYAVIVGSFLLAGFVKGIVGLGLPTISLALLTVLLDLPTAMALLVVPAFCTKSRYLFSNIVFICIPFVNFPNTWIHFSENTCVF